MNFKLLSKSIVGILIVLSIFTSGYTAYLSINLLHSINENNRIQEKRTSSILLADELRQSSDDLTNFARMYAITEDPKYKFIYNRIIDIRNGEVTRPPGYQEVYWDLAVLNTNGINLFTIIVDENGNELGEKISMDEMMLDMGMDQFELKHIRESKLRSDSLAIIEMEVFDIIENSSDPEIKSKAIGNLFDVNYLSTKARIMKPIKEFYRHVDERTAEELKVSQKKTKDSVFWILGSITFTMFSIFMLRLAIHYSRKKNDSLIKNLNTKNTYLEHAAKIIRHDMHSGINTYIPRGVKSLKRRLEGILSNEDKDKIKSPLHMIEGGLTHTQKVYKSVYEFTNLVKKDAKLELSLCNVGDELKDFLSTTSYKSSVKIGENLPEIRINKWLMCTAIDNLIRNGLTYNDSSTKIVKIYNSKGSIIVEDNGRGMSKEEFKRLSLPYARKSDQKEMGSGLGLNISISIIDVHGFKIDCEKIDQGTRISITY